MARLKVFGGLTTRSERGQIKTVVATTSQRKAADLLGMSLYEFSMYWSETGNEGDIAAAMAAPETVVYRGAEELEAERLLASSRRAAEAAACRGIPTDKLTDGLVGELRGELQRLVNWLDTLTVQSEASAESTRHETMREAYTADARNFRATAKSGRALLARLPEPK